MDIPKPPQLPPLPPSFQPTARPGNISSFRVPTPPNLMPSSVSEDSPTPYLLLTIVIVAILSLAGAIVYVLFLK